MIVLRIVREQLSSRACFSPLAVGVAEGDNGSDMYMLNRHLAFRYIKLGKTKLY